jgi:hypothetical protein
MVYLKRKNEGPKFNREKRSIDGRKAKIYTLGF